jgi:glycine/serine hydroxymethyltransferase
MDLYEHIKQEDQEVYDAIEGEEKREREGLELIPSENYVSAAVREAMGSVFTNKYSEGFPGKRYYGGQEFTDAVETLAIERAKKLFGADHANVQPLGGAAANIAAYFAWMEPGDTILGMDLGHGGHLTHGAPVTYMAKLFRFVRYKMKNADTGEINYDEMLEVAKKERPKIILGGFSAYPRELDWQRISDIAKEVGAVAMADVAHIAGLIAGGAAKNPLDYGFQIMTTTTHKTLRGPRGAMILSKGIVSSPLKAPDKTIENLPTLIDRSVFPGFQGGPHMHQIAANEVDVAVGGANSRLNVEKLLSVKELMRAKHVDFEREQIYCILTAKDESALMREAEITSREFNGDAPVMQDGRLVRFLGINFIYCELAETVLAGTNEVTIPVWVKSGMHLGMWNEITSDISQRKDIQGLPWQAYIYMTAGATRIDEDKVYAIESYRS